MYFHPKEITHEFNVLLQPQSNAAIPEDKSESTWDIYNFGYHLFSSFTRAKLLLLHCTERAKMMPNILSSSVLSYNSVYCTKSIELQCNLDLVKSNLGTFTI